MSKSNTQKKIQTGKGGTSAELRRFLLKTVMILLTLFLAFGVLLQVKRAEGNEMSPFVRDGDLCLFLRQAEPSVGDVVLYRTEEGQLKIGRVAAAGGQEVDFYENGGFTVDGYEPSEEIPYETWRDEASDVEYPLQLEENQLFLMNDFRSLQSDSRSFGPVNTEDIEGTLLFLLRRRGF